MTTTAEGSIVVHAPVSAVYQRWTQFEDFPQFMGGVVSVTFLTDTRLEWVAEPEGIREQWETEIELVPEQKVSWSGVDGAVNSGTATFSETEDGYTEIHLSCEYDLGEEVEAPEESRADVVRNSAQKDLQQFKELIESEGETQTGDAAPSEPTS